MASLRFTLLIAGLAPTLAFCGEVNRSWDVIVQSLQPGKTVVVTRMNTVKVEGKLLSIASDSITVRRNGQPQVVQREDVYRVRIANIRRRHTLIGMAVGAVVAAVAVRSKLVGGSESQRTNATLLGAAFGVGPGAAVGGALPIGKPLYEAPGGLRQNAP